MAARHRWVKLRIHVYICRKCGTGKVNARRGGEWVTTFHRPDGVGVESRHVPACDVGPLTDKYLGAYRETLERVSALEEAAK